MVEKTMFTIYLSYTYLASGWGLQETEISAALSPLRLRKGLYFTTLYLQVHKISA